MNSRWVFQQSLIFCYDVVGSGSTVPHFLHVRSSWLALNAAATFTIPADKLRQDGNRRFGEFRAKIVLRENPMNE